MTSDARDAGVVDTRHLFLANASIVLDAVSDPAVASAWDHGSILDGQTIGSLAGHLARGSVWVVADYLDAAAPTGPPDFENAAEYYAAIASQLTGDDHASIRDRGARIAADGHQIVVARLTAHVADLTRRLPTERPDRLVAAFGGRVMRLDDYLETRLVEQVVHLDDLARSLAVDPWPVVPAAESLVLRCGTEIGRLRSGGPAMIRALFRDRPEPLPVL